MRRLFFLAAIAGLAGGQTFEVATVRSAGSSVDEQVKALLDGSWGMRANGNQFTIKLWPLKTMVAVAYEVDIRQVTGPDWISREFYNVQALMPVGSTEKQMPGMLRELLQDRFKLDIARTTVERDAYVLQVAPGGHKMKPTPDSVPLDVKQKSSRNSDGSMRTEDERMTMPKLASLLTLLTDKVVLDQTELPGDFTVVLNTPEAEFSEFGQIDPGRDLAAVIEKLGLLLRRVNTPMPQITIQSAERTPTEN